MVVSALSRRFRPDGVGGGASGAVGAVLEVVGGGSACSCRTSSRLRSSSISVYSANKCSGQRPWVAAGLSNGAFSPMSASFPSFSHLAHTIFIVGRLLLGPPQPEGRGVNAPRPAQVHSREKAKLSQV